MRSRGLGRRTKAPRLIPTYDQNHLPRDNVWQAEATRAFYTAHSELVLAAAADNNPPTRILQNDAPGIPYTDTEQVITCAAHVGQLKLLLSEIDALTKWVANTPYLTCVYAGSAPGHKMGFLMELFPTVTFVLVDPNPHHIMFKGDDQYHVAHRDKFLYFCTAEDKNAEGKTVNVWDGTHIITQQRTKWEGAHNFYTDITSLICKEQQHKTRRVYIIEDYFTNETAESLSSLPNLHFISDIRTKDPNDEFPSNFHILWNNALHFTWLEIMRCPSMTKFRCPFEITALDKEAIRAAYQRASLIQKATFEQCTVDYLGLFQQGRFIHLDGEIHLQAFAPPSSTETRLFTAAVSDLDGIPQAEYNYTRYEQALFYVNKIDLYHGGYQIQPEEIALAAKMGLCRCRNCALSLTIIQEYITNHTYGGSPVLLLHDALTSMRRTLKVAGHGCYLAPFANTTDFFYMLGQTAATRAKHCEPIKHNSQPAPTLAPTATPIADIDTMDDILSRLLD